MGPPAWPGDVNPERATVAGQAVLPGTERERTKTHTASGP